MITIHDFAKSYGDVKILQDIELKVDTGEALVLIGPSGCGKSTLLRHVAGIEDESSGPFSGRIDVGDVQDLLRWPEQKLLHQRIRGNRIGMLFQEGALFDFCNVEENLSWPLRENHKLSPTEILDRIQSTLEQVEMHRIRGLLSKEIRELSGGQKRRIALARSLLLEPDTMLYDEPTAGLDPPVAMDIAKLIRRLSESRGLTSITATHDMNSARIIADRVCFMRDGQIRFIGRIDECETHPEIRHFLQGEVDYAAQTIQ
ncbi:MAG: ATP-binding cassette domain-containing protein [Planctomycetota bacterium]|jgi:phospholipid/cholesterol/gamma-HCH transport system ATP-binding protein|nr:ATP-binding cassette domain-containing protein [Planctomycetota bacterium]